MEQLELSIKRIATQTDYTIGHLYVNGKLFCDTFENTDRGLDQKMTLEDLQKRKVYGKTAIPTGTFQVIMNCKSP